MVTAKPKRKQTLMPTEVRARSTPDDDSTKPTCFMLMWRAPTADESGPATHPESNLLSPLESQTSPITQKYTALGQIEIELRSTPADELDELDRQCVRVEKRNGTINQPRLRFFKKLKFFTKNQECKNREGLSQDEILPRGPSVCVCELAQSVLCVWTSSLIGGMHHAQ